MSKLFTGTYTKQSWNDPVNCKLVIKTEHPLEAPISPVIKTPWDTIESILKFCGKIVKINIEQRRTDKRITAVITTTDLSFKDKNGFTKWFDEHKNDIHEIKLFSSKGILNKYNITNID